MRYLEIHSKLYTNIFFIYKLKLLRKLGHDFRTSFPKIKNIFTNIKTRANYMSTANEVRNMMAGVMQLYQLHNKTTL